MGNILSHVKCPILIKADIMNLLNEKSNIAGDSVVRKLSKHHDGEREVFLSKSLIAANRGFDDAQ